MTASIYLRAALIVVLAAHAPSAVLGGSSDDGGDVVIDAGGYDDTPYEQIDNPTGISKLEYLDLLNLKREVVEFWTPDRLNEAKPFQMDLGHTGLNKSYHESKDLDLGDAAADADGDGEEDVRHRRNLRSLQDVRYDAWNSNGDVLHAAGRLMYQNGGKVYRCSATAIEDGDLEDGQSLIITAAHCVYDDIGKAFATNFMFIPHQDDRGFDESDYNCNNDKYGCWIPSHAVVDRLWSSKTWDDNIFHDYAFLVVPNVGSHRGPSGVNDSLESAVPALEVGWDRPRFGELSYAFGYPVKHDTASRPSDFRYCRKTLAERADRDGSMLVLNGCGLSQGTSGGPWIQDMNGQGRGKIIGVNSYGPGGLWSFLNYMESPRLYNNSAWCLFEKARRVSRADAKGGIIVTWAPGDCAGSVVRNRWGNVIPRNTQDFLRTTPEPTSSPSEPTASTPEPTPAPTPLATSSPTSVSIPSHPQAHIPAPTPEPTPAPTPEPTTPPTTSEPTPSPTPAPTTTPPTSMPTRRPTAAPRTPAPTPAICNTFLGFVFGC
eukprot:CAMPEP_0181120444 /NCGR_PEP_ID=MMETSP1071-20121207/24162_1 /TAXON_ID=35127 /ORGANISM="Thalassiosira sp., Strain NH16" /LENGTH=544 /DNA_ID=CAMNT_0023205105 /DNA_START=4 /DNA_END=1638 /DNA_ORIENTATION=-